MSCRTLLLFCAVAFTLCFKYEAKAQCTSAIVSGHVFLTPPQGCAPYEVIIKNLYTFATIDAIYIVDWGDGTVEVLSGAMDPIDGGFADPIYTPDFTHTYAANNTDCGYDIIIEATNACTLPEDARLELSVSIWDTDLDDFALDPGLIRVCQGFASTVQFQDASDWNCFPRPFRENSAPRWIQWIYGVGPAANRIPGVQVAAVSPGIYPYNNPSPGFNPLYPVNAPVETSLPISVPATVPADVGREFLVRLRNWNQCNPYDANVSDGGLNPVNGDFANGDSTPIEIIGRIVIVESPQPSYQTRETDASGVLKTIFCLNDLIYFEDLTPFIAGSAFTYSWEFFDGPLDTDPLLTTSNNQNPTFSFSTSGQKLTRLRITDGNAQGNCQETFDSFVNIFPSSIATLSSTAAAFCQNPVIASYADLPVTINDVSTGTNVNTAWTWNFFRKNSMTAVDSTDSPTGQQSVDAIYNEPGFYAIELITRDIVTNCDSRDTLIITVFEEPTSDFNASVACLGEVTSFIDMSTHNSVNNDSIVQWEWDFDNDGTFDQIYSAVPPDTVFHTFAAVGVQNVTLRTSTNGNSCGSSVTQTVIVNPQPIATFTASPLSGCADLDVLLRNTSIPSQPSAILSYTWQIDDGSGFVNAATQIPSDPLFADSLLLTLTNTTSASKNYDIRLRTISADSCEAFGVPINVTVFPAPQVGFTDINYDPLADNCSPLNIDFAIDAATTLLNPDAFIWTIRNENVTIHTQTNPGTDPLFNFIFTNDSTNSQIYSITLEASKSGFCFRDSTISLKVNPIPSVDFNIDTLLFDCDTLKINVDATQKGLSLYEWEIEVNGATVSSTSLGDNFDYSFARPNPVFADLNVSIRLQTTNLVGCVNGPGQQDIIVPRRQDINAFFTVTPATQTLPNSSVSLVNMSNSGPWTYAWDFGDSSNSTLEQPGSHTYTQYGDYLITLMVVSSDSSCVETHTELIRINPISPLVDFDYDPPVGCKPLAVTFTNLSQFADPDSYFWDFGDGRTSMETDPVHTYVSASEYSVSLRASNPVDTVTELKTFIIEVFESPIASFDARPNPVYIPAERVVFRNTSTGGSSYFWDFGDGSTSTEENPEHLYTSEGSFAISLIVTSINGCIDTLHVENAVQAVSSGQVIIPNAFTPSLFGPNNGSIESYGRNDVFYPVTENVSEFNMQIFNRWGTMLFQSTNKNIGWDGYYNGQLSKQDTYVYKVEMTFSNMEKITRIGDFQLIR